MALAALAGVFMVVWLTGGTGKPRRSKLGPAGRSNMRHKLRALEASATRDGKAAMRARREARSSARSLFRNEWDAAFWEGTHPTRAESFRGNVRRAQGYVATLTASADKLERDALASLKAAAVLQRQLDRDARPRRAQPGLITLARVCAQGAFARPRNP